MGFVVHRNSYLRDYWNWLDLMVVIFGLLEELELPSRTNAIDMMKGEQKEEKQEDGGRRTAEYFMEMAEQAGAGFQDLQKDEAPPQKEVSVSASGKATWASTTCRCLLREASSA